MREDGIRVHGGGTGGFSSAVLESHIPAERVDRAWRDRTRDLGPAGEVTVSCEAPSGRVVADVTIAFAGDTVAVRIAFEPSGRIGGLRVLPPQAEPAPRPG